MKHQKPGENVVPTPVGTLETGQHSKGKDTNIHASDESEDTEQSDTVCAAGLSVILGQMVAYFSGRANVDDMDVLSFSLHHLFCRVDYLYRTALPELMSCSPSMMSEQSLTESLLARQYIWTQLRAIKQSISRIEPLCNLLCDATRCILDALDMTGESYTSSDDTIPQLAAHGKGEEQEWLQTLNQERWDHALTTLTECLSYWQQSYGQLALFVNHFAHVVRTIPMLPQLDGVFNILLDSTAAIFGDILPGFQAISVGDDEGVATLLFDLMQQADQLLVQLDTTLEPLQALIEYFALPASR